MATDFEIYMAANMPKRSALETYESVGYDGNPNNGSAPAALQNAPKGTWFLQQTGTIYWRKRSSAANSWIIASINETYEEMDIYVRAIDGSDNNLGTSSSPLATLTEAVNRIPYHVNHAIRIHVGPHSGSGYIRPIITQKALNENIYIIGDGGGGGTDGFTELLSSTAALSGSSNQVIKTSGLSTTEYGGFGEYWGKTIEILTGSAAGDRRTIRDNTATDIYPNAPFSATISTGDTYRIIEPETVIYYSDPNNLILASGVGTHIDEQYTTDRGNSLFLINFKLETTQSYFEISFSNTSVVFLGIEFAKRPKITVTRTLFASGVENINSVADYNVRSAYNDLDTPNEKSWAGWGCVVINSTVGQGSLSLYGGGNYIGSINAEYMNNVRCKTTFVFGSIWGGQYQAILNTHESVLYISSTFKDILIGSLTATTIGIDNGGYLNIATFGSIKTIIKCSGNVITSKQNGLAIFITSGGIELYTTSGIGMVTKNHGQIQVSLLPPTISASGNDFSEDNGTTIRSIAVLTNNISFDDLTHGSIYRGVF